MAKLDFTKDVFKYLQSLPAKQFKQVTTKMLELAVNTTPADYSKLKGYDDLYRVDIGEYRIVYRFDKTTVSIVVIGARNDDEAYKKLKRQ